MNEVHVENGKPKQQGTSRAYILDRLKRGRRDLFAKVEAGKMSARSAAIAAGWIKEPTALEIIRKLAPKLTAVERQRLRALLDQLDESPATHHDR